MAPLRPALAALTVAATQLAAPLPEAGRADQPPVVAPGGTYACTIRVLNDGWETRRVTLRARLRGNRFWGSPEQSAVRGPWVTLEPLVLDPGDDRSVSCELPVPFPSPPVLSVLVRGARRGVLAWGNTPYFPLAEAAPLPAGDPGAGPVPFRIVAGGLAAYDPEDPFDGVRTTVLRTAGAWESLRDAWGIRPPDSWGPAEPREWDDGRVRFASAEPPDPGGETLLALRSEEYSSPLTPRRLWVRSVDRRPDGSLLCRYTYRAERVNLHGRPTYGISYGGSFLLIAVPRTDAPVEFRRVR